MMIHSDIFLHSLLIWMGSIADRLDFLLCCLEVWTKVCFDKILSSWNFYILYNPEKLSLEVDPLFGLWNLEVNLPLVDGDLPLHCKYVRPDYDGTLAIHRSTMVAPTTIVVRSRMNG